MPGNQEKLSMKALFATLAAIGLIATPVIAAPTAKTVTTKVTPTSNKGAKQARAKTRGARSNAMAAKITKKSAQSARKAG